MPRRKDVHWSELKVGLVALTSLILLAITIFLITGQTGLFSETMTLRTYSPDAGGLKTGAVVRLAGVDVGNVRRVALSGRPEPDEAVEIVMEVNRRFSSEIRTDSQVFLAAEGLLGERYINISKGTVAGQPIPADGVVPFHQTAEFSELVGGSRDLIDNLNVLTSRLNSIVGSMEEGQGTIGRLIKDDTLYRRLDTTVNNAQRLVNDITAGRGSLGQLLQNPELYDRANQTVTRFERVVNQIETGDGTIAMLIRDPSLYRNAEQLVTRGNLLVDNINQGKGTLGKLATDDQFYERLNRSVGNLDTLLADLRDGEGTMGRLLHDPALYNSLNSTSVEVRELIADFRKNPKKFLTIQFRIF